MPGVWKGIAFFYLARNARTDYIQVSDRPENQRQGDAEMRCIDCAFTKSDKGCVEGVTNGYSGKAQYTHIPFYRSWEKWGAV
ncbi:hypothetical protein AGMMS50255_6960 [Spirochaetia bacterium]|nr:hypothetical protein AGMMS50255_6960 [Spirochaetia bacterium]